MTQITNITKSMSKKTTLFIVFLCFMCIVVLAVMFSYKVYGDADFAAINGHWQTYNTSRRILSGQVPFLDFISYLGVGLNYFISFVTLIFGNTFIGSKMAVIFLSFILLCLLFFEIMYFRTSKLKISSILTTIFAIGVVSIDKIPAIIDRLPSFTQALSNGNSLRSIRIGGIYIVALFLVLILSKKIKILNNDSKAFTFLEKYKIPILFAILASLFRFYSNDIGIAIISSLFFFWILLYFNKNKVSLILIILVYIIGFIILGNIFTFGNLGNWFEYNSLIGSDVSSYQSWFFLAETNASLKDYLKVIIFPSWQSLAVISYSFYILIKCIIARRSNKDFLHLFLLSFIGFALFLSNLIYKVGSGGDAYLFIFNLYILFILISEIVSLIIFLANKKFEFKFGKPFEKVSLGLSILAFVCICIFCIPKIFDIINVEKNILKNEVEKNLGGVSDLSTQIDQAYELTKNGTVWSTYASALEYQKGVLQPSGIDYIIHALGDKSRAEYLRKFHEVQPDFVATISDSYDNWETWILSANWFFYRDFMSNYSLKSNVGYLNIYEKDEDQTFLPENIILEIDDDNIELSISDYKGYYFGKSIADLEIIYDTSYSSKINKFLTINPTIYLNNGYGRFNLPGVKSQTKVTVPVYIDENGKGILNFVSGAPQLYNMNIQSTKVNFLVPYDKNTNNNIQK